MPTVDLNICRLTVGAQVQMKNMKKSKTFMFESQDQLTSFELVHQRLRPRNKQFISLIHELMYFPPNENSGEKVAAWMIHTGHLLTAECAGRSFTAPLLPKSRPQS